VSSLVTTVTETLRYRGAIGQWSWVLHRLSGLGVLLFFVLHIIDTSWAVFYPGLYEKAIASYQTPLFTFGEFILVAAVVYHAYNGLRIVILDFKPQWWFYQQRAAYWVLGVTALTLIPVFIVMFSHVLHFHDGNPNMLSLGQVLEAQVPFVIGIAAAIVAAIAYAALTSVLVREPEVGKAGGQRVERFWWSYMRLSGLLIVPLVFGHLALMHMVQGVFDLTVAGTTVTGTGGLINDSGTAVEFVGHRWNYLVAGVALWRLYDFGLLALAAVHGFNGLRYVLTDYTMDNPVLRRASIYLCIIGAVVMLVMGGGALLGSIDSSAIQMAIESQIRLGLR
jgi:succinate dehydrogenase cytochrome b556 subunit